MTKQFFESEKIAILSQFSFSLLLSFPTDTLIEVRNLLDNTVLAFTADQLTAHNRYDPQSIFTQYKHQKTLDLFRQFESRQAIVAAVKAIKSPTIRLNFVAEGLSQILKAASNQDWTAIERILLTHFTVEDLDNDSDFMENITKLYDVLSIITCIQLSMEENQLIARAVSNVVVPLTAAKSHTICQRCFEPDESVDCRKHTCKNCMNHRRRRSTSAMHNVELVCRNCVANDVSTKRQKISIECSICCDKCTNYGKSKRCTDCPNRFHEKCHPNASKCPECSVSHQKSSRRRNHVMLTKIDEQFWPIVIVAKQQVPTELAERKFGSLKPGTAIAFCIGKNVYRRVYTMNLLSLHFNNPMARDAICLPHVTGLNDAIGIAEGIYCTRRRR